MQCWEVNRRKPHSSQCQGQPSHLPPAAQRADPDRQQLASRAERQYWVTGAAPIFSLPLFAWWCWCFSAKWSNMHTQCPCPVMNTLHLFNRPHSVWIDLRRPSASSFVHIWLCTNEPRTHTSLPSPGTFVNWLKPASILQQHQTCQTVLLASVFWMEPNLTSQMCQAAEGDL